MKQRYTLFFKETDSPDFLNRIQYCLDKDLYTEYTDQTKKKQNRNFI